jgi:hypothetical protein
MKFTITIKVPNVAQNVDTIKGKKKFAELQKKSEKLINTKEIALHDLIENNKANILLKKEYRKAIKQQIKVLLIDKSINAIMCNYHSELVSTITNLQNKNK